MIIIVIEHKLKLKHINLNHLSSTFEKKYRNSTLFFLTFIKSIPFVHKNKNRNT